MRQYMPASGAARHARLHPIVCGHKSHENRRSVHGRVLMCTALLVSGTAGAAGAAGRCELATAAPAPRGGAGLPRGCCAASGARRGLPRAAHCGVQSGASRWCCPRHLSAHRATSGSTRVAACWALIWPIPHATPSGSVRDIQQHHRERGMLFGNEPGCRCRRGGVQWGVLAHVAPPLQMLAAAATDANDVQLGHGHGPWKQL